MKLLLPLVLFAAGVRPPSPAADWTQYNGPDHSRSVDLRLDARGWSEAPPRELWRDEARTGFSSFCVADGRAFTLERRRSGGGSAESCVARDAETGKVLWQVALCPDEYDGGGEQGADGNKGGDGPRSTPACSAGRVFALDSAFGLTCIDAAAGEVAWRVELPEAFAGQDLKWGNAASPVLAAGLVIVAGGGPGRTFLAFDQAGGKLAWSTGDERVTHATPTVASLHGEQQVIFLVESGLVALRATDGHELWRAEYPYRTSSAASPVVDGSLVYVSAGYGVGAGVFRVEPDGEQGLRAVLLWQKRNDLMNHWSTPLALDGKLYGLYGFKQYGDGPLACVDMESGEVLWEQPGFGPGGLIRAGEDLLVLGDAGQLVRVAADPGGYRELGRLEALEGKCWSSPALAGDRLYLRSTEEGVCYRLPLAE